MKSITDRHQFILQKLQESGRVTIPELSDLMEVSGVTIRKDLKLLEDKNLLFRTRGGGSIHNPYTSEKPIDEKELIKAEEKQKIAKAALSLIGHNDAIIIGSGTTVFQLARCLHPSKPITVISPAVKVTLELCNRPHVEALQLGGLIRPNSSSVAGSYAEQIGLSITNLTEATLNQKMIASAQEIVVLADSTKFGRRGLGRVCSLDQVQYIITDSGVPARTVEVLQEKGIKVIIAK